MPQERSTERRLGPARASPRPPTTSSRSRSTSTGSRQNSIEACFFDQNYQFEELTTLRRDRASRRSAASSGSASATSTSQPTQRGLRRRLLDDPRRAGALRGDGDRRAPTSSGASTPSTTPRRPTARTDGVDFHYHGGSARQAQAVQGGRQRLLRHARAGAAADRQGADRRERMKFLEEAVEEGRAGRARPRGPAHRRAPADVRQLPRLHGAGALGGPRPPPLRGDRLRHADRLQRRPADERARHRRRQRPARPLPSTTAWPTPGSRRRPSTSPGSTAAISRLADRGSAPSSRRGARDAQGPQLGADRPRRRAARRTGLSRRQALVPGTLANPCRSSRARKPSPSGHPCRSSSASAAPARRCCG